MTTTLRCFSLALLVSSLSGCSLIYDPCGDLETRLCTDLGPADCGVFRGDERIHGSVIPQRRRSAERSQCEMFADDANYAGYTLPYVRYQVQQRSNPTLAMPALATPRPAGLSGGLASYLWYFLPCITIPAIFIYSFWSMRRRGGLMAGMVPAYQPQPYVPPQAAQATSWDHVDSRAAAEQVAQTGALVAVELVPGMGRMPENVVYVTPQAAARMREITMQIEQLVRGGQSAQLIVEPQYKGRSFVPSALVVRFGDRAETVQVW
ncbi:hypothetical protein [Sandaracinus amylolyticus]|uniref:hypothetical protein n=1 Tax=Sandaracinus amylolyticus TaxID=927083 RepID=UPI001F42665D|nr:hypothetical protein [Sandaracinus amylolyticus]UJR86459.1 Hypothetical protein I5071_85540 [Sandaracinus amylolyticus]